MNILYTAFNGKNNSSKILLDKINSNNKLYLKNSFITSVKELEKIILTENYDLIISFGQAPLEANNIKIETIGRGKTEFKTNFNYDNLVSILKENNYKVSISSNAGRYLCNNLYYEGLKLINEKELKSKMIFIHIPKIKNINDIDNLAKIFDEGVFILL